MPCNDPGRDITELLDSFERCSPILAAIGDPNRQKILASLIRTPGQRVEQIREATDLSRPAVSHHLKILKDASAVTVLRKGTRNYYFPFCESGIWAELEGLTSRICGIAERLSQDDTLEKRRRMLIDEHDDRDDEEETCGEVLPPRQGGGGEDRSPSRSG